MPSKSLAVVQSNYIPWKGYFDLINAADEFVLYDDVQYTKNDWRNRNKIQTPQGPQWLTIPVKTSGNFGDTIKDVNVSTQKWRKKHWKSLVQNYGKAPFFAEYKDRFETLFLDSHEARLSGINAVFIREICKMLGIETTIHWSMDFQMPEDRVERLIFLNEALGCDHYLSGPAARAYMDQRLHEFDDKGIKVSFVDYTGYPEYTQLHSPFVHAVSALDLIFTQGPDAPRYMKTFSHSIASVPLVK